jgi:hypothetical protein
MKCVSFAEDSLRINDSIVRFGHPIAEVTQVADILLVLLSPLKGRKMTENVFGVNMDGVVVWQIEPCLENSTDPLNYYTGFGVINADQNSVVLSNWGGTAVKIDAGTGKILDRWFAK